MWFEVTVHGDRTGESATELRRLLWDVVLGPVQQSSAVSVGQDAPDIRLGARVAVVAVPGVVTAIGEWLRARRPEVSFSVRGPGGDTVDLTGDNAAAVAYRFARTAEAGEADAGAVAVEQEWDVFSHPEPGETDAAPPAGHTARHRYEDFAPPGPDFDDD